MQRRLEGTEFVWRVNQLEAKKLLFNAKRTILQFRRQRSPFNHGSTNDGSCNSGFELALEIAL